MNKHGRTHSIVEHHTDDQNDVAHRQTFSRRSPIRNNISDFLKFQQTCKQPERGRHLAAGQSTEMKPKYRT